MICPFCRNEVDDNTVFCSFCGGMIANLPSEKPAPSKAFGIVSMILGILSLVTSCVWPVAITFAIIAFIFACVGISKARQADTKNGFATAGLITSLVSLIPTVALLALSGIAALLGSM
ncbi:MAG: zinc ribbon domain-containing protein [Clostridia bacterium]|nr:zinc ribbon domain-containing protein [Clostridia bacterium]